MSVRTHHRKYRILALVVFKYCGNNLWQSLLDASPCQVVNPGWWVSGRTDGEVGYKQPVVFNPTKFSSSKSYHQMRLEFCLFNNVQVNRANKLSSLKESQCCSLTYDQPNKGKYSKQWYQGKNAEIPGKLRFVKFH